MNLFLQLYQKRDKVLKDPEDQKLWDKMNPSTISDLESSDESQGVVARALPWRGQQYDDLVWRIDEALGVQRKYGELSERKPDYKCSGVLDDS